MNFGKSGMRDLFYIWLVFVDPSVGVTFQKLDTPYVDAKECVHEANKRYTEAQKKYPNFKGAFCYTPEEFNGPKEE